MKRFVSFFLDKNRVNNMDHGIMIILCIVKMYIPGNNMKKKKQIVKDNIE